MELTINDYLQVLPNYEFPERSILVALGNHGIESGVNAYQYDENGVEPEDWVRRKELARADMWEAASGLANISGGTRKLESRSITDKGFQVSGEDRASWRAEADRIRARYGKSVKTTDIYNATFNW